MNSTEVQNFFEAAVALNGQVLGQQTSFHGRLTLAKAMEQVFGGWSRSDEKTPEGFTVKLEEHFGGEGQGDQYWNVYSITNTATTEVTYVRFNAWYSSDNGHEWNGGFDLVEPKQVTVRQWEDKK